MFERAFISQLQWSDQDTAFCLGSTDLVNIELNWTVMAFLFLQHFLPNFTEIPFFHWKISPPCSTKISQPTSPSHWEMLTGCDVSVTRPEVERLRFANTHIYTLIIAPSHHTIIPLFQWIYYEPSIEKTCYHRPP